VIHILFTQGHIDQAELLWDIVFVNAWGRIDDQSHLLRLEVDAWASRVKDIADEALLTSLQKIEPVV
jgi:hypothetical protein